MTEPNEDRQATVGEVFAIPEFRALWFARCLSLIGDQLARVALAILAFDQTGSPALTALTYALTYLPAVVSGPLLSGLADRYPRRAVMIAADLAVTEKALGATGVRSGGGIVVPPAAGNGTLLAFVKE